MTHEKRHGAARTIASVAGIALLIVLANLAFNAFALPHIDLPDLPDLPGWLAFALGKGKLIVIAVIFVLAVIGEESVRRHGDDDGQDS